MAALIIFLKFFVTGGLGFALDFSISKLLFQKMNIALLIANSVGFLSGEVLKYSVNRSWTFASHDPDIVGQFSKFICLSLIGLVLVNIIVYFSVKKFQKPFLVSKVMAMVVFMFFNFTANYFYTFAR